MKSLSIVFTDKEKVEVQETEVGTPGPEQILCRAERSLISTGTETLCLRGISDPGTVWDEWVKYPFYPGYGMAATVVAVGSEVKGIKEGDRIAATANHTQYFITNEKHAHLLPDKISFEEATWMSLACTTQLGVRRAELELGETVGVIGMGMLGQLVVQYLRAFGARHIFAIDPIQGRLEIAKANGATHTLAMDANSAIEEVHKITNGKMLDVVLDVTGHPAVLAPATQLVRKLGRVILLGDTTTPSKQGLGPRVVSNSVSILGIHGTMYPQTGTVFNQWTLREMTSLFFDYLMQDRMNAERLITHRHSPVEAPQVYEWLLRDRSSAVGVVFDWTKL